jgi:hypothetical protein
MPQKHQLRETPLTPHGCPANPQPQCNPCSSRDATTTYPGGVHSFDQPHQSHRSTTAELAGQRYVMFHQGNRGRTSYSRSKRAHQ